MISKIRSKTPDFGNTTKPADKIPSANPIIDMQIELVHTDTSDITYNTPIRSLSRILAMSSIYYILDNDDVRNELDRGLTGGKASSLYRKKCRFITALIDEKHEDAYRIAVKLILEELHVISSLKHSVLRYLLEDGTRGIVPTYDQIERLFSGCLSEILEKAEERGFSSRWRSRVSLIGDHSNIPQSLEFITSRYNIAGGDLTLAFLEATNMYCIEVFVYYDFIKMIKISYLGRMDELETLTYRDIYKRVKRHIPYQFIFVKKSRDDSTIRDSGRFFIRLYQNKPLISIEGIRDRWKKYNVKHILVSRIVPEIVDFDKYEDHLDFVQPRVFYLKMKDNITPIDKNAVFTCMPGYGFKPVADALIPLLRYSIAGPFEDKEYDDIMNMKKVEYSKRDYDLSELLAAKVPNFEKSTLKPDESPYLLQFNDCLSKLTSSDGHYHHILRRRPHIMTISMHYTRHISQMPYTIALDNGRLEYSLAHAHVVAYEDSRSCVSCRMDNMSVNYNLLSGCVVHYYEKVGE